MHGDYNLEQARDPLALTMKKTRSKSSKRHRKEGSKLHSAEKTGKKEGSLSSSQGIQKNLKVNWLESFMLKRTFDEGANSELMDSMAETGAHAATFNNSRVKTGDEKDYVGSPTSNGTEPNETAGLSMAFKKNRPASTSNLLVPTTKKKSSQKKMSSSAVKDKKSPSVLQLHTLQKEAGMDKIMNSNLLDNQDAASPTLMVDHKALLNNQRLFMTEDPNAPGGSRSFSIENTNGSPEGQQIITQEVHLKTLTSKSSYNWDESPNSSFQKKTPKNVRDNRTKKSVLDELPLSKSFTQALTIPDSTKSKGYCLNEPMEKMLGSDIMSEITDAPPSLKQIRKDVVGSPKADKEEKTMEKSLKCRKVKSSEGKRPKNKKPRNSLLTGQTEHKEKEPVITVAIDKSKLRGSKKTTNNNTADSSMKSVQHILEQQQHLTHTQTSPRIPNIIVGLEALTQEHPSTTGRSKLLNGSPMSRAAKEAKEAKKEKKAAPKQIKVKEFETTRRKSQEVEKQPVAKAAQGSSEKKPKTKRKSKAKQADDFILELQEAGTEKKTVKDMSQSARNFNDLYERGGTDRYEEEKKQSEFGLIKHKVVSESDLRVAIEEDKEEEKAQNSSYNSLQSKNREASHSRSHSDQMPKQSSSSSGKNSELNEDLLSNFDVLLKFAEKKILMKAQQENIDHDVAMVQYLKELQENMNSGQKIPRIVDERMSGDSASDQKVAQLPKGNNLLRKFCESETLVIREGFDDNTQSDINASPYERVTSETEHYSNLPLDSNLELGTGVYSDRYNANIAYWEQSSPNLILQAEHMIPYLDAQKDVLSHGSRLRNNAQNLDKEEEKMDNNKDFWSFLSETMDKIDNIQTAEESSTCIDMMYEILREIEVQEVQLQMGQKYGLQGISQEHEKTKLDFKELKVRVGNKLAAQLYINDRYTEALAELRKVLELEPHNIQALYKTHEAYMKVNNYREAKAVLKRIKELMQAPPPQIREETNPLMHYSPLNLLQRNFIKTITEVDESIDESCSNFDQSSQILS